MATFTSSDDLHGAEFVEVDLTGARISGADLSEVVMRGVIVRETEIDAPWLAQQERSLIVNGVDVTAYVEAELDRRFPGREQRRAPDPAGLRQAWAAAETAWATALARAAAMPPGTVATSVDGEWSFAQTLRHLVMATDAWLGRGVLGIEQPFHPLGLAFTGVTDDELDLSLFTSTEPTYDEVLAARAERVAMVRDYLDAVTPEALDEPRNNPWAPERPATVRSCLHVVLREEWEHLRYVVRDLDAIESPCS
ncbi:DinB family protein [Nocardioides houyundeii]|uniref:DinB family protein n=1 Tax=Nocardioides houyundeii TaxID=2045452 RepID=UPI000C793A8C|nr:DinB family protein [Nocardioides houyundeii]